MKTFLITTMALGFFVILSANQTAKAWGYDPVVYRFPNSGGYAYPYRGYPGCGEVRTGYYRTQGYCPTYAAPACRLICRHDFLGNPYNCHPVCS